MKAGSAIGLRAGCVGLIAGTLGLVPGTAQAAVVAEFSAGVLTLTGDDTAEQVVVSCVDGITRVSGATGATPRCDRVGRMVVRVRGGRDEVRLQGVEFPALATTSVDVSDSAVDQVYGTAVADSVVGDGYDFATTGAGDDALLGVGRSYAGPGDDVIGSYITLTRGVLDDVGLAAVGAAGLDTWTANIGGIPARMTARLDDTQITLGESSMPVSGIEQLKLTFRDSARFDAAAFPGTLEVTGSPEADGLTGGPNSDLITSGAGDDVIAVLDGVADTVDCGAGTDSVVADSADVLVSCEVADIAVVPPAPTPPPPPPPPPAEPAPPAPPAPPVVPETSRVKGKKKVTKPRPAKFRFSSPTPGATLECRVDGRRWSPCAAPYRVATKRLKRGKHVFRVRAVLGEQVDPSPSRWRFRVRVRR